LEFANDTSLGNGTNGKLYNVVSRSIRPFRQPGEPIWAPDRNNFGPRFGLAWDIGGNSKNVIRAGVEFSLAQYLPGGDCVGQSTGQPYTTANRQPRVPRSRYPIDCSKLDLKRFPGPLHRNTRFLRPSTTHDLQRTVELDFQREITHDLVANGRYVGNRGLKARPCIGSMTLILLPAASGFPVRRVSYQEHSGMSNYHSLQASLKKRFSRDFMFQSALHLRQGD